jgi:hypothetical protein
VQQLAQLLDRDIVVLPQREHREILRVGEAKRIEQRLVGAVEGMRGRIDREAEHRAQP